MIRLARYFKLLSTLEQTSSFTCVGLDEYIIPYMVCSR
ncbi:hypothetical protein V6Z12_A02G084900 [Gossypium hirsutum]